MFQSSVAINAGFGIPGELLTNSPTRAREYIIESDNAAYNIVGATALTVVSQGIAKAGGTGVFAGILANPKVYALRGTQAGGTLAPTLTLPNEINVEAVSMGQIIVTLPAAANIGDLVAYDNTDGSLATFAPTTTISGSIANSTGVLTVTATDGYIQTNRLITGTGIPAGTRITGQVSGTAGSTGTYSTNITTAVSAFTDGKINNDVAVLGAGYTQIPNAFVFAYDNTGSGLAVIQLTD